MNEKNENINNQEDKAKMNNIITETKNSIFKSLFKNLKVEISEKVMTKLLVKVDKLEKENEFLRNENKSLKNHLIYLLRKILLNKAEYSTVNKNISNDIGKANLLSKSKTKTTCIMFNSSKRLDLNSSYCNNSLNKTTIIPNNNNAQSTRNKNIESKINGYLNAIYRNNFITNNNGLSIERCLNSKKSVFDDLMSEIKKNNKNERNKNNNNSVKSNNSICNLTEDKKDVNIIKSNNNTNAMKHFPTMRNKISIIRKNKRANETKDKIVLNKESDSMLSSNKSAIDNKRNKEIKDNKIKKKIIRDKILNNNNRVTYKCPYLANKF